MNASRPLCRTLHVILLVAALPLLASCAASGTARYTVAAAGSPAYVTALPAGTRVLVVGGVRYHYHVGRFYRPAGHRWVVVQGPVGARIATLPAGAHSVRVKGIAYRRLHGTHYRWSPSGRVWIVARP